MRIGHGFDVHRLVKDRKLILGGIEVPHESGLIGHSDADVLCHAINDALLGAASLGDIGQHFPDSDPEYAGISSLVLVQRVVGLLTQHNYRIINIDATVIAQKPKLAPYIPQMRRAIAETIGVPFERISVKATTTEKLGFAGREEGIAAHAVVLIEEIEKI